MAERIRNHIRSNIVGFAALFLVLTGGSAYALDGSNTVFSDDIVNGEVKTGDIGDFEVKGADVAPDSLGGAKIADGSVKNADLGAGASSSNTIADGGIQGIDVKNNTLTGTQIDEPTLFNDNSLTGGDIDESTLAGFWKLDGNSGTTGADFLGTTDNQPFNLRVNNARGLRLEPASNGITQSPNVIGGIADNSVTPGVHSATIGGGGLAVEFEPTTANRVTDHQGTVGGGANNQAGDGAGTVGDRTLATVGGGENNTASGVRATVGGGGGNIASGFDATIGGGTGNDATGQLATVPGGFENTAQGDYSLAAGRNAQADHNGAFVWADSGGLAFASTAQDQFSVRSTGGARFVSAIDGTGNPTAGVSLAPGGGSWSSLSDEASKRVVEPASGLEVLRKLDSVPISTWSYRAQDDSVRHIGPMAQDFFRAFGVGEDRRHIASVDADGVALAAIKGLNDKVERLQRKVTSLKEREGTR
jgi:hypothetical protein